mgnify:CR=1 FL=1
MLLDLDISHFLELRSGCIKGRRTVQQQVREERKKYLSKPRILHRPTLNSQNKIHWLQLKKHRRWQSGSDILSTPTTAHAVSFLSAAHHHSAVTLLLMVRHALGLSVVARLPVCLQLLWVHYESAKLILTFLLVTDPLLDHFLWTNMHQTLTLNVYNFHWLLCQVSWLYVQYSWSYSRKTLFVYVRTNEQKHFSIRRDFFKCHFY